MNVPKTAAGSCASSEEREASTAEQIDALSWLYSKRLARVSIREPNGRPESWVRPRTRYRNLPLPASLRGEGERA
jgi:hypothetical protein